MSLVLDAGGFLALERMDRDVIALLKAEFLAHRVPATHGGVIGQVWRGGRKQANLSRFLPSVDVVAIDRDLGRRAGQLLARSGTSDVIDAGVVLLAMDGDSILTSDTGDLRALAHAAGKHVDLIRV